jgi:hypothetical protein
MCNTHLPLQYRFAPSDTFCRYKFMAVVPLHFRSGYDMAVSEVKLPVSEVKPPPESRSGQKFPLEVKKSCG